MKSCPACQEVKQALPVAPLQPWIWPSQPWKRIHMILLDHLWEVRTLLLVDAHSKWPEVHYMSSTTAAKTIQVLRTMFARYGIPEQLVSDNGPQFVSEEFGQFMKLNGIISTSSAPLTTPLLMVKLSNLFASKLFVLARGRAYLLIRDCRISY